MVVSPLWVEESIKAGRRLVERKYLVSGMGARADLLEARGLAAQSSWLAPSLPSHRCRHAPILDACSVGCARDCLHIAAQQPASCRLRLQVKKPTESLLGRTPGSGAGAAAKKRKRPAAAVLPKPAEAYELDDLVFSSTQQMHNDLAGPADDAAGEVCSPRGGKQPRRGAAGGRGTAGKQQRGGRGGRSAAAAMPAVAEEEEEQEEAAEAVQEGRAPGVGSDTQAVSSGGITAVRACLAAGLPCYALLPLALLPLAHAG